MVIRAARNETEAAQLVIRPTVLLERRLEAAKGSLSSRKRKRYQALLEVPDSITADLKTYTKDPAVIERQRHRVARAVEALNTSD